VADEVPNSAAVTVSAPPVEDAELTGLPQVGDLIADKYRVEKVLGKGGMGVVVAVTHVALNESYAMKFLLPSAVGNEEAIARFMREARAAVRIKSEHVARVSDIGTLPSGCPYILMEHLTGKDLSTLLSTGGPLTQKEAIDLLLQACVGVAEAHSLGLVHRDLKPSNLYLTERLDGTPLVKVLDFGISKPLHDRIAEEPTLTRTNTLIGSPAYMSPEQLRNPKAADIRADIWSIGVILYKMLTGHAPFRADTWSGLVSAITADKPVSLRAIRPEISPHLEPVVARCLEKDVSRRFQNVAELAKELAPFASDASRVYVDSIVRLGARLTSGSESSVAAIKRQDEVAPRSVPPTHKPWVASTLPEELRPRSARRFGIWAVAALAGVGLFSAGLIVRSAGGDKQSSASGSAAAPNSAAAIATAPAEVTASPPSVTPEPAHSAAAKPAESAAPSAPAPRPSAATSPARRPPARAQPTTGAKRTARPAGESTSEPLDPTAESH
jgi:serine/threonine-protein kinase